MCLHIKQIELYTLLTNKPLDKISIHKYPLWSKRPGDKYNTLNLLSTAEMERKKSSLVRHPCYFSQFRIKPVYFKCIAGLFLLCHLFCWCITALWKLPLLTYPVNSMAANDFSHRLQGRCYSLKKPKGKCLYWF